MSTFLNVGQYPYDWIVAADVLYSGMDGLFARVLAAHLPSPTERVATTTDDEPPTRALIACPFRKDSPLLNFFAITARPGLELERLENASGHAAGATSGVNAKEAFADSEFVPIGNGSIETFTNTKSQWERIAKEPTFSIHNRDKIQIFRVRRLSGTAEEARSIRRVGRL